MKLKSLLMGSAAALVTVSLGHAADPAPVAEPEPVEYVKVCDMYGAGYAYIPRTETCLKFDGLIRTTYLSTSYGDDVVDANGDHVEDISKWSYRARLNVTFKSETDLDTLTTVIRFQGEGTGGSDADVGIDRALISLGGFRIGYTDQYWTTNHGYGTPGPIDDSPSGFDQATIMDYTFNTEAMDITVGIQDEVGGENTDDNVDIYAGVNAGGSWGTAAATLGYDTGDESSAVRLSLSLTMIEDLEIKGLYATSLDEGEDGAHANHFIGSEWEYGVGAKYQATDSLDVYVAYYDAEPEDSGAVVVGGNWKFADGIRLQTEASFEEADTTDVRVRVQRSF